MNRTAITVQRQALQRVLAMPASVIARIAGPPPRVDGRELNPATSLILAFDRWGLAGKPSEDVATRRRNMRTSTALVMPTDTSVSVNDTTIPGPAGDIRVRTYRPREATGPTPLIVYYHGGGWVVGDLDSHDGSCRLLARHSGCTVISVDYRLAPEHPFPAGLDDAEAAFKYVHAHPTRFGGIPGQVAVAGDSAGGNLAAAVCLRTRDTGPAPIALALIYPAVDLRMTAPSIKTFATGYFLTEADMHWYRDHYLSDPDLVTDPLVSPALADDLSNLPPTAIWTAGFDPLRDEGMRFAEQLADAGVPVTHTCVDDQIHGFFGIAITPDGLSTIEQVSRSVGELVRGTR